MIILDNMDYIIKTENIRNAIVPLRGIDVIPDFLVAELYGVQTKEVNQAVKNNPDKFPLGYILEYTKEEKSELVKKFDRFNIKHSSAKVKAFTEREVVYADHYSKKSGCNADYHCYNRNIYRSKGAEEAIVGDS